MKKITLICLCIITILGICIGYFTDYKICGLIGSVAMIAFYMILIINTIKQRKR